MRSDKQIKKDFMIIAQEKYAEYYPVTALEAEGFHRNKCEKTGVWFWSTDKNRKVCGDNSVVGFTVANNPSTNKMSYENVWTSFRHHFEERGYKAIKRYPVVARWNPTIDFTIASIAAFQPYVVNGQVDPPAKKVVIPQYCLRFGDVENVGITGSHLTGFVMIGQHQFVSKNEWNQDMAFMDVYTYLINKVGVNKKDLILHEDVWAGGGNFGPSIEFFCNGVELFNQVYMMFEETVNGARELETKVLDMGLGMERIAWFSQGTENVYEATFPYVLQKFKKQCSMQYDKQLLAKFSEYAGELNIDEVDDIEHAWRTVADKLNVPVSTLRSELRPVTHAYVVTEHARSILIAINDGQLPSNVGGGYNIRMLLRRCFDVIREEQWNITLPDIMTWHAEELVTLFPELKQNLVDTLKIVNVEKSKYDDSYENARKKAVKLLQKTFSIKDIITLHKSHGVSPEMLTEVIKEEGLNIELPQGIYAAISEEKHTVQQREKTQSLVPEKKLLTIQDTKIEYYQDWSITKFTAKVVLVHENVVVLDKTHFYPTSGGQEYDEGTINGIQVTSLQRVGKHILHQLESCNISVGDTVSCEIEYDRRKQLAQHHSSAHIINAAARIILGNHVNQAGAHKKFDKAHLDITHYEGLTPKIEQIIEAQSNKLILEEHPINSIFMQRSEAEQKYSVRIYQGGVAPGNVLRIVDMPGIEAEACGGTHLRNTKEAELIRIVSSTKLSDGIVRINYVAGAAAKRLDETSHSIVLKLSKLLNCSVTHVPAYSQALFTLWKKVRKAKKKGVDIDKTLNVVEHASDHDLSDRQVLLKVSDIYGTQIEHLVKTTVRFQHDIN